MGGGGGGEVRRWWGLQECLEKRVGGVAFMIS